jgi:hypothetical protein
MKTQTTPAVDKRGAVEMLRRYIATRSGMDRRLYQRDARDVDGARAFRSDYNGILRDGRDARRMLEFVASRDGITVADILAARNGNGRLEFVSTDTGAVRLDYTAGQFFATEYRAAACGLLAGLIRRYLADGNPVCIGREAIRLAARGYFGRGIASRWFS